MQGTHTHSFHEHNAMGLAQLMMKDFSLSPGTVITLGGVHKFRFNHPAEAAVLRERRRVGANRPKTNVMLLIRMTIMKIFMMSR